MSCEDDKHEARKEDGNLNKSFGRAARAQNEGSDAAKFAAWILSGESKHHLFQAILRLIDTHTPSVLWMTLVMCEDSSPRLLG